MPRRPEVPCARCGTLLWGGKGTLPEGQRTCRPCRRVQPQPYGPHKGTPLAVYEARLAKSQRPKRDIPRWINCATCGTGFHPRTYNNRFCGPECRELARLAIGRAPTERDRERWRNRSSTSSRGYGYEWQLVRRIVLAEESVCGFCGDDVDKGLRFPDPLSPSVDHIVRKEDGGTDDRSNLRLAHLGCNAAGQARRRSMRVPTACVMCGTRYTRQHDEQRTCSRACGELHRTLNAA
jgi:predicted nucleic acid-binding Zn ribbon protein